MFKFFIHAEAGILDWFSTKKNFALLQNYFYKEVNSSNRIMTYDNYLQKFESQNFIKTCIKLLMKFHWRSNIQKNEEKIKDFEKEFLITNNFDKFWPNPKF